MEIEEALEQQDLVEFSRLLRGGATLIVSPPNLNAWSMQAICLALITPEFKVNILCFDGNNFIDTTYIQAIAEALQSADCKITELNFSRCIFNLENLNALADGLNSPNCRVKTLFLSTSVIDDASVAIIARILTSEHCKIKYLNISRHSLSGAGLKAILEASKHRNTLVSLYCDEPAQLNMTADDVIDCFNYTAQDPFSKIDTLCLPVQQFSPADQLEIRNHMAQQNKRLNKVDPGIVQVLYAMDNARGALLFRQPAISRLPPEHKPMLAQMLMQIQPICTGLIETPPRNPLLRPL